MKKYTLILLLFVYFFSSCEDVVELDLKEGKEAFVVEGWITTKPGTHFVKLYKTVPFFNKPEYPAVRNATVVLSDDAGNTETLTEAEPGKYEIKTIKGEVGRSYKLSIVASEGRYEASTKLERLSWRMDSVTYQYKKKSVMVEKEGYYPAVHGQEAKGPGDFLILKITRNGKLLQSSKEINLFSDEFVDGNYIKAAEPELAEPFAKGDKLKYENWSLTEDAYLFWTDIKTQLRNGGLFAVPATNVRTNVVKKDATSMPVVGYFGASDVGTLENEIK